MRHLPVSTCTATVTLRGWGGGGRQETTSSDFQTDVQKPVFGEGLSVQ